MLPAAVLLLAAAAVFYIVAGYPLILALSRSRAAPPVAKDARYKPTTSIVLAVHDGERYIADKLENLLTLDYPTDLRDILVVSDGSDDGTDAIVEAYANRGVELLRIPRGGKAQAINAALARVRGEIVFFTDVRQKLAPGSLADLAANFADPTVGVATGELRFHNTVRVGEQADVGLYWRYEIWARGRHCEIDSMFGATGCIYAVRRRLASALWPDTLADDVVMPLRVFLAGYRVILDPAAVAWDYRTAEGGEFRRKLRTLAGLWQVFTRMPELFARANRMRFHFLSHKFARLVLPWAVLAACAATFALPDSTIRAVLLSDEAVLLGMALLDFLLPRPFFLKRLTSPARTFLTINLAALLSVVVFVAPPATLWGATRVSIPGHKPAL
jgi:cellulose synthase/poly-beta-1,6-N-acetylglucosamine synthase-like glycosyltransferase